MFRVGIVTAQDLDNLRVRVRFPDRAGIVSWWLPIVVQKTQNDKFYWIPDIGEQVVCMMDARDEDGAVLGAIYSSADTTPVQSADKWHVTFEDDAFLEYDRKAHVLTHTARDGAVIKYDGGTHVLTISLPAGATFSFSVGGDDGTVMQVDADGDFTWYSIATAALYGAGAMTIGSDHDIELLTDLFSTSVDQILTTLNAIIHLLATAVQPGSGISGTPAEF